MPASWDAFYTAQLGASAALTGLLFVGISINMAKIVAIRVLPNRALQSLVLLGTVLVLSSFALVPNQSSPWFAGELVALGVVATYLVARVDLRTLAEIDPRYRRSAQVEAATSLGATASYIGAGVWLAVVGPGGLYLAVPGVLASYLVALLDAWVLLVEINR